jgi:hypothetical protein
MVFDRTEPGIKNTPLFYHKKLLVYVEGPDDEVFWAQVFPRKIGKKTLRFKPVGGSEQLDRRVQILLDSNTADSEKHFVVARDSNYRKLKRELLKHPQVVETEYHSIENVMLCKCQITRIVRTLGRRMEYPESSVENWLKIYDSKVYPLMIADFLNGERARRTSVMGNNCARFSVQKQPHLLDESVIKRHIRKSGFSESDITNARISKRFYKARNYSRGHFYLTSVWSFIRFESARLRGIKRVRVSRESLFALAVTLCKKCLKTNGKIKKLVEMARIAAQTA